MDKITLNKQIVLLRKEVERAKVRVINKLARDIKCLKVAKSWHTDELKEKNLKKVERIIAELSLIKKSVKDDVSKLALTSTRKSLDAIRSDPSEPVEKKAMARLASHPQLTSSVEKFRSQFPDWESTLPPLVDNLGVRVKHRKRNRERMSVASTAEGGSSKTECENATNTTVGPVVQKHSATLEIIKDKIPVTQSLTNKKKDKKLKKTTQKLVTVGGVWEVEVEDEHAITFSEQNIDTSSCSAQVQGQSNGKTKIKTAHKNTKSVPTEPSKTSKITTTDKSTVNKSSATKVIRFSELIEMETKLDKIRKTKKVKKGHNSVVKRVNDKPTAISEPKEVDSFFVSEDGKTEFLSIVTAKEPLEVRDETQLHKYAKLREKYLNEYGRIPNRKELRMRERQKFSSGYSSFTHEPERSTSQFESKRTKDVAALDFQPKSSKPIRPLHAKASEAEGPVHPSWEAKRKAKEMLLTTFQGKKIKFED